MKIKKVLSIIFYAIAIFFIGVYGIAEIMPHLYMAEFARLFLLCGSCLFLFIGGIFWCKYTNSNKAMKTNLWIFFGLYLVLLITLTLFDPMWGRNGFNAFNWNKEGLNIYLDNSVNLIPFKTVIGYGQDMFSSLTSTRTIFFNLLGNIVCLMPFAFFLPLLFENKYNTKKFIITILCVTLGIELIQFATFTGSCDIDDIILNTLGAFIMYKILEIKSIKNLIKNIFLLEKNEVNWKVVVKVAIIIIGVVIACGILIKARERYYDDALDEHTAKYNYKIEIVDESTVTADALEKFYEDDLYEYYFSSIKSDYVYAIINGNEKHLVKDLLNNNPTEYVIRIDRLERAGLDFIKQEKYEKVELTVQGSVHSREEIESKEIFEIKSGTTAYGQGQTKFELFIVPKISGKSKLTLNFYDNENDELVETKEYLVTVDENLKVEYEEN